MTKKTEKDPYLSELESLEDIEGDTTPDVENSHDADAEATHIDVKAPLPHDEENYEEIQPDQKGQPITQDILNLASDIPVSLVVVMGKKAVSVQDLLQMRTGEVIQLEKGLMDPVDVVAAGKVIAKAELVNVEGRLGIRILKLLK